MSIEHIFFVIFSLEELDFHYISLPFLAAANVVSLSVMYLIPYLEMWGNPDLLNYPRAERKKEALYIYNADRQCFIVEKTLTTV